MLSVVPKNSLGGMLSHTQCPLCPPRELEEGFSRRRGIGTGFPAGAILVETRRVGFPWTLGSLFNILGPSLVIHRREGCTGRV